MLIKLGLCKEKTEVVPEPGIPDTPIRRRCDLGKSSNFSHVFLTSRSTCSSILMCYSPLTGEVA